MKLSIRYISSFFLFNKLFLSTLLILSISNSFESFHYCGFDLISHNPRKISEINKIPKSLNSKKSFFSTVDEDGFKDLNIYIETTTFEDELIEYNLTRHKDLFLNWMKKAKKTIETLLKIKPIDEDI